MRREKSRCRTPIRRRCIDERVTTDTADGLLIAMPGRISTVPRPPSRVKRADE